MNPTRLHHTVSFVALLVMGWSVCLPEASAQLPPPPVMLEVTPTTGVAPRSDFANSLTVRLTSRSAQPLRGVLRIEASGATRPAELPIDLPASSTRVAEMTFWAGQPPSWRRELKVKFLVDGRVLSNVETKSLDERPVGDRGSVVVLSDQNRARSLIDGLTASRMVQRYNRLEFVSMNVSAMLAATLPETGEYILPSLAVGYTEVELVVAHAAHLEQVRGVRREALVGYLRGGGQLLVLPRSTGDLRGAFLSELVGATGLADTAEPDPFLSSGGVRARVVGEGLDEEAFGASKGIGFGRVYIAAFDAAGETQHEPHYKAIVQGILERESLLVAPIRKREISEVQQKGLDPNAGYKPALYFAVVLLLFYVLVVGPLNFAFIEKRNKPVLALVTTPIIAFVCALILLMAGYASKGMRTRHRTVQLVDLVEGRGGGITQRSSGLFFTRPMQADVSADPGELIYLSDPGSEDLDAPTLLGGERVQLTELDGRLWKTAFLRGEGHENVGGNVTFGRDGDRLATVTNHLGKAITGACIIDADGKVYVVGEIAAGASADIPRDARYRLRLEYRHNNAEQKAAKALEDALGTSAEVAQIVAGHYSGIDDNQHKMPFLLAVVDNDERDLGPFGPALDSRVLRVVPRASTTRLLMPPPIHRPANPAIQGPVTP